MDGYPAELVTPPLALVALLGSPELHAPVGEFLRSHHKPPINSVGVADPLAVGRLFGARKLDPIAQTRLTGLYRAVQHRQGAPTAPSQCAMCTEDR